MKKEYINPEMEVVKLEYQQFLAASDPVVDGSGETSDPNDLLAPGFTF